MPFLFRNRGPKVQWLKILRYHSDRIQLNPCRAGSYLIPVHSFSLKKQRGNAVYDIITRIIRSRWSLDRQFRTYSTDKVVGIVVLIVTAEVDICCQLAFCSETTFGATMKNEESRLCDELQVRAAGASAVDTCHKVRYCHMHDLLISPPCLLSRREV